MERTTKLKRKKKPREKSLELFQKEKTQRIRLRQFIAREIL
ncbi:hypothetical protein ES702_07487 [subsurface metagenome]